MDDKEINFDGGDYSRMAMAMIQWRGSCERGNGPIDLIPREKYLNQLSDNQLPLNKSVLRIECLSSQKHVRRPLTRSSFLHTHDATPCSLGLFTH